jgi:hypothetical protein
MQHGPTKHNKGFSVIELGIAVAFASTVAIGYLVWAKPGNETNAEKIALTKERVVAIEQALSDFYVQESRLPCPADPLMRPDNTRVSGQIASDFGRENMVLDVSGVTCPDKVGMPPVLSLGLEEEYAYDAWGRQFSYHVSGNLCGSDISEVNETEAAACTAKEFKESNGDLTVQNPNDEDLTEEAAYVLLSYGTQGVGGYLPSGQRLAGSTENSNGDNIYKLTANTDENMNLVTFRTKAQLVSLTLDPLSTVISVSACNSNSETIESMTRNDSISLSDASTGLTQFQLSSGDLTRNTGNEMMVSMLMGIQEMCVEYFSNVADNELGWIGPKCPGGAEYKTALNICLCSSGTWDSDCENELADLQECEDGLTWSNNQCVAL